MRMGGTPNKWKTGPPAFVNVEKQEVAEEQRQGSGRRQEGTRGRDRRVGLRGSLPSVCGVAVEFELEIVLILERRWARVICCLWQESLVETKLKKK